MGSYLHITDGLMRSVAVAAGLLIGFGASPGGQAALVDRTINAAGASIHIRCGGERGPGPVVIFEAGAGGGADAWTPVHAAVAGSVRACAYDRPSTPSSGPAPNGLMATQYSEFLRNVLKSAGELPPYVMVGHSFGGIVVSLYAATYPADVVGMVLVDSSHEDQMRRFEAVTGPPPPPPASPPPGAAPPPPPGLRFPDFAAALRATPFKRDIPLVVLTGAKPLPDPTAARLAPLWLELQRELAARSSRSSHIVLKEAGHFIQRDDPQAVIDAIRAIVAPPPKR